MIFNNKRKLRKYLTKYMEPLCRKQGYKIKSEENGTIIYENSFYEIKFGLEYRIEKLECEVYIKRFSNETFPAIGDLFSLKEFFGEELEGDVDVLLPEIKNDLEEQIHGFALYFYIAGPFLHQIGIEKWREYFQWLDSRY